jgi:16S rRNA (guanine1516-N2)-methyltransferase
MAGRFGLRLAPHPQKSDRYALFLTDQRLELRSLQAERVVPVFAEFVHGPAGFRRLRGGGTRQVIARAVGIRGGVRPAVVDATAGFGRDAFVLAGLGCFVTLVERSAPIAALVDDGLARALRDRQVAPISRRMTLKWGESRQALSALAQSEPPDVVYLDPMYPERTRSAVAKKEMRVLRDLVGDDADAPELLATALQVARARVVVKRPRAAPCLRGPPPGYAIQTPNTRLDIYPVGRCRRDADSC